MNKTKKGETKGERGKSLNLKQHIVKLYNQEKDIKKKLDLLENQREKLFIEFKYAKGIEEENAIIFNIEMNKMNYKILLMKLEKTNTKLRKAKMDFGLLSICNDLL